MRRCVQTFDWYCISVRHHLAIAGHYNRRHKIQLMSLSHERIASAIRGRLYENLSVDSDVAQQQRLRAAPSVLFSVR